MKCWCIRIRDSLSNHDENGGVSKPLRLYGRHCLRAREDHQQSVGGSDERPPRSASSGLAQYGSLAMIRDKMKLGIQSLVVESMLVAAVGCAAQPGEPPAVSPAVSEVI